MAETIQLACDGTTKKWHWYNIVRDLEEQGRLSGVIIYPSTVYGHKCCGTFQGNFFCITWVHDRFLLLTMWVPSPALVNAFAAVVEYRPFCRYERDELITVEWDKTDPEGRFAALQAEEEISKLELLP